MFPEESCPFCVRTPNQSNISCSCRKLCTGCSSLGLLNYWSLRWRGLQVNGQTGTVGAGRVGPQRTPASTVGVGRGLLEPLSTAALCALRPGRTVTGHSPASPATSGIRPAEGQGQGEEGEGRACRGLPLLPAARPQRGRAQCRRCARLGAAQLGTTGPDTHPPRPRCCFAHLQPCRGFTKWALSLALSLLGTWHLAIRLLFPLRVIFPLQGERISENSYVVPKVGKVHESRVITWGFSLGDDWKNSVLTN